MHSRGGRIHPGASDVRSRMSEAGQDLFSRHGYGITLLQVIDQAGTPRGSIYYHFHDAEEELAIEVMSRVATALEKLVASAGRRKTEPTEFLQALSIITSRGLSSPNIMRDAR